MNVYEVVFEELDENRELHNVISYVEAASFDLVSNEMIKRQGELDWELKSIRYVLPVSEKIYLDEK